MGPYQRTPKKVTRAIKYPGLGVRSVGPVGDFLESFEQNITQDCVYLGNKIKKYIIMHVDLGRTKDPF